MTSRFHIKESWVEIDMPEGWVRIDATDDGEFRFYTHNGMGISKNDALFNSDRSDERRQQLKIGRDGLKILHEWIGKQLDKPTIPEPPLGTIVSYYSDATKSWHNRTRGMNGWSRNGLFNSGIDWKNVIGRAAPGTLCILGTPLNPA